MSPGQSPGFFFSKTLICQRLARSSFAAFSNFSRLRRFTEQYRLGGGHPGHQRPCLFRLCEAQFRGKPNHYPWQYNGIPGGDGPRESYVNVQLHGRRSVPRSEQPRLRRRQ